MYYSLEDENHAARMGFFINVVPKSQLAKATDNVVVRKWDKELQNFVALCEQDEVAFQSGVLNFDFDRNLGPYPM